MDPAIYQQMRQIEDHHWWFVARRLIIRDILSTLTLPADAQILDAGCGTGGNLQLLSEFGDVCGLELDPIAAQAARARNTGKVSEGSFPNNIPYDDMEFNLITLLDVLEHIDDDKSTLFSVGTKLANNGYLLITVPAFEFLWSDHDVYHHHKRRYRAPGLQHVIKSAGFKTEYINYYNTLLFPLVFAARLVSRMLPKKDAENSTKIPQALINKAFLGIFSSERHLLKRLKFPYGVSIIAVARKL